MCIRDSLQSGLIQNRPVVLGRSQSGGGSHGEHVDVVAHRVSHSALVLGLLDSGGSAGGVSMLTNDHAAVCNQSFGSSAFLVDIEPGVGVHNFHGNIGVNALHAQEECSVAGNNLSIVVSADIADLDLAVSGKAVGLGLRGQGAGLNQFLQLHTGNNTGNIAALINIGESVLEVIQASQGSKITGHGNKSDIGILFSFFYDIGLVAVRVGNNKVAALKTTMQNGTVEEIKSGMDELQKAIYAVSEKLYKASAPQQGEQAAPGANPQQGGQNPNGDVYDADYKDVD